MARRGHRASPARKAENQKRKNKNGLFLPENCALQRKERSARLRGASPCNMHWKTMHIDPSETEVRANRLGFWPIPSKKRLGLEVRAHAIMHWKRRHINPSAKRAHHALMALCNGRENIASWADRNFPAKREDAAASLNRLRSLLLGCELFQLVRQLPHLFLGEGAGCLLVGLELLLDLTDPLLRFLIAELLLQGHYITGSINVAVCLLLPSKISFM